MSHKSTFNSTFYALLIAIDNELIVQAQLQGCPYCGGVLHKADYPRSPLGLPAQHRGHFDERFSLCCADCRKRTTPPSVRFFGRRRFPAALLVLVSVLKCGINERRVAQIRRHFGIVVSESTWKRWRRWWREVFVNTAFWRQFKALVPIPEQGHFPGDLLKAFHGNIESKMRTLLEFISPITGGILRAV
jgi:hypothetical protein